MDDIYSLFVFIRYKFLPKSSYKLWNETWKKKLESADGSTRSRAFKRFQPIVAAVTLRRTKLDTIEGKELISLPARNMEVKETDFRMASEALAYQKLKEDSHNEINRLKSSTGGLGKNYTGIMLLLLRLRQACCHPFLAEYAASKQRGRNGAGDVTFVSPYSVSELDEAQVLIESGISSLDRLGETATEKALAELAPPKAGAPLPLPELDMFACIACKQPSLPSTARIHAQLGTTFCRTCSDSVRFNPLFQITPATDPFLELDDIRREIHVKIRSARAAAKPKKGQKRANASRGTEIQKRPRASDVGESSAAQPAASPSSSPPASRSPSPMPSEDSDTVDPRMRQPSTKISIILETLRAMRDRDPEQKCLVFSQWTSMLDIISFHVKNAGYKCCRLDGTMNMLKRKAEVEKFRSDGDVTVFLLSMHAAGTGLNLTEANNVIMADCWWNPSVEAQCCDRAHRIGQTRPVQITRMKVKGTCEEKIYEMCARKAETCASALGDSGGKSSGRQKMTLEDAVALFGSENDNVVIPLGPDADEGTRTAMADIQNILQGRGEAAGPSNPGPSNTLN